MRTYYHNSKFSQEAISENIFTKICIMSFLLFFINSIFQVCLAQNKPIVVCDISFEYKTAQSNREKGYWAEYIPSDPPKWYKTRSTRHSHNNSNKHYYKQNDYESFSGNENNSGSSNYKQNWDPISFEISIDCNGSYNESWTRTRQLTSGTTSTGDTDNKSWSNCDDFFISSYNCEDRRSENIYSSDEDFMLSLIYSYKKTSTKCDYGLRSKQIYSGESYDYDTLNYNNYRSLTDEYTTSELIKNVMLDLDECDIKSMEWGASCNKGDNSVSPGTAGRGLSGNEKELTLKRLMYRVRLSLLTERGIPYEIRWMERFVSKDNNVTREIPKKEIIMGTGGSLLYSSEYIIDPPYSDGTISVVKVEPEFDIVGMSFDDNPLLPDGKSKTQASVSISPDNATFRSRIRWEIVPNKNGNNLGVKINNITGEIRAGKKRGFVKVRAYDKDFSGCTYYEELLKLDCPGGCAGGCGLGSGRAANGCVEFNLNLGNTSAGESAGEIFIVHKDPGPLVYTPYGLQVSSNPEDDDVDLIYDANGMLKQIKVPQGLFAIVVPDVFDCSYAINVYSPDVIGGKVGGYYEINGDPKVIWDISNPDEIAPDETDFSEAFRRVNITKTMDSWSSSYAYTWDVTKQDWILAEGGGLRIESKESIEGSELGERIEETIVSNSNGDDALKVKCKYQNLFFSEVLMEKIVDPDGAALTTLWEYYDEEDSDDRYGEVKSVLNPDGSWERFEYDELGRNTVTVKPWKDSSLTSENNEAHIIQNIYDPNVTDNAATVPESVVEYIQNIPVTRSYFTSELVNQEKIEKDYQCKDPNATIDNENNLVTETLYYSDTEPAIAAEKVKQITYPDGRMDSYVYETGTYIEDLNVPANCSFVAGNGDASSETVIHGISQNPNGIANKTTKDVTVRDERGNVVLTEQYVYDGSAYHRIDWKVQTYNELSQIEDVYYADGTAENTVWSDCCGQDSFVARDGTVSVYGYDGLGRRETVTKEGITGFSGIPEADILTTYILDAEGRTKSQTISAGGLSILTSTEYDLAGRVDYSTDAAGLITEYDYESGGRITTSERPGLGAETSENYLDGQLKSVTGNGTIHQYYDYGVNPDGTRWTTVYTGPDGLDSPMWEKTTIDALGRTIKTEKPGYNGTIVSENFYNNKGQLYKTTKTGVPDSLYEYDDLGNQYRQGLYLDDNGSLELNTMDRITDNNTTYELLNGDWWRTSTIITYTKDNDPTPTTTSIQRERLTGFLGGLVSETISIDADGNETITKRSVDRNNKTTTTTIDHPDSNIAEEIITVNGLRQSHRSKTGILQTFKYDALGRRVGVTIPRVGETETKYNTKGQIEYIEDGQDNRTTYTYDSESGLKNSMINALTHTTYYSYNDRGQLEKTWGPATYPVQHIYDDYGRMVQMNTYRGGIGWDQATWPDTTGFTDTTKWNYDPASGLLESKEDAKNQQVQYTYTVDGKLNTRTWARGIETTYTYTDAGDLWTVVYSDDTPTVTYTRDRLGRIKTVTDSVGQRTFSYTDLKLNSEAITGLYDKTITRKYQAIGTGEIPGRNGGFNIGTEYDVTYGYDAFGRFNKVINGNQTYEYGYLTDTDLSDTIAYKIDAYTKMSVIKQYDNLNRLWKVTNGNNITPGVISTYTYTYNSLHQRDRVDLLDTSYWIYTYDSRGQLETAKRYLSDGTPVSGQQYEYGFDNIGNRKKEIRNDNPATRKTLYSANKLNQYTQRTVPGWADIMGSAEADATVTVNLQPVTRQNDYFHKELLLDNITQAAYEEVKTVGVKNGVGPEGEDVIAEETGNIYLPKTPEKYLYDEDGNLKQDGRWDYTWNAENRLIKMETISTLSGNVPLQRLEFKYDYMGRRISKKVYKNDNTTWLLDAEYHYIYNGWNMISEISNLSSEPQTSIRSFVWGLDLSGSLQGAGGIGGLLSMTDDQSSTLFYTYDSNGNVMNLLNPTNGEIEGTYEYGPFGEQIRTTGSSATDNPIRFSTKYYDESDLYYYGFRFYNPRLGRWLNRDPIGENGGLNYYSFVLNNPVNSYDLFGLKGCCGADHTKSLRNKLAEANRRFNSRGWWGKFFGCFKMFVWPGTGTTAWDLEFTKSQGSGGSCKGTVTISDKCYHESDVNYALWGLGAKRCHLAYKAAVGESWIYKIFKAVDNYFSKTYAPGSGGTPEGIWEFSQAMTGWEKYGFNYPNGNFPNTQNNYKDCVAAKDVGVVKLKTWPW